MNKLTDQDILRLKELYFNKEPTVVIAEQLKVSKSTVHRLLVDLGLKEQNAVNHRLTFVSNLDDEENIQRAVDKRQIRIEYVSGKKMYDIFDFMFDS